MRTIDLNYTEETNSQKKQKLDRNSNRVDVGTDVGRSLMKIKRRGPTILPCGTPETTGNAVDLLPSIDAH